jgi:hypothetical protein
MRYLLFLLLLLTIACVKEPIGSYDEGGVIEIGSDTAVVLFNVPDPGDDGWGNGMNDTGEVVKTMDLTFREKGGQDVAITTVYWTFYNHDGGYVSSGYVDFVPPFDVLAGSQEAYTLSVTVDEGIANNLDDHDGSPDDWNGTGTIKFMVTGFDRHWGNDINDIPSYTPMRVAR